jgi:hypothetical protein
MYFWRKVTRESQCVKWEKVMASAVLPTTRAVQVEENGDRTCTYVWKRLSGGPHEADTHIGTPKAKANDRRYRHAAYGQHHAMQKQKQ